MEAFKYQPFQVVLAALDFTDMDDHVIRYTSMLSKTLPLERIYFLHVAKELELPEELLKKYPTLMAPLDESMEGDIKQKVEKYFKGSNVKTECVVKDGVPIDKILKFVKVKRVDLILMGRKRSLEGSGLVSSHIARKCPSSLLLVPESTRSEIKKALVPIDFSRYAALAVKHAEAMVKSLSGAVDLIHIYNVPKGYYKIGKTYEEFDKVIKGHAMNDCARFLKNHQLPSDMKCTYFSDENTGKAELVHSHANACQADIIIIGSRGRTDASAILIGSFAERLVFLESDIPVLIVKRKGKNMGFMKTLFRI